jgi:hypothetical protein
MQPTCHEPVSLYENICGRILPPVSMLQKEKSPPKTVKDLSLSVFRKLFWAVYHLFENQRTKKQPESELQVAV